MVRISDTLSRQEKDFTPDNNVVRMYVCGMTPKFHPHVGHARIFVAADVLRRYLEYRGYTVRHVQNFTDIDDKIIARAHDEDRTPEEVAKEYSDSYFEAMDALNVLRAHEYPTVTGVMPQIIAFVQGLVESGHAYVGESEPGSTGGRDVWFAVETYPQYGELAGRVGALDEQQQGVRVELEPGKRDPRDFALWKSAKPGEPAWESPWGPGRPGWHIECSAMVRETLGDTIDIHGGGRDLIFPHHENERAQSEALLGKLFVRYWAHAGLVETAGGEKMSHSLLNFRTVHDVLQAYDPMALRLYLLQTHYRAPLTFREDALVAAAQGLARLRGAVEPPQAPHDGGVVGDTPTPPGLRGKLGEGGGTPPTPPGRGTPPAPPERTWEVPPGRGVPLHPEGEDGPPRRGAPLPPRGEDAGGAVAARARFEAAMDDDFNTSAALATLFDLAKEINSRRQDPAAATSVAAGQATLRELAGVLGIDLTPRAAAASAGAEPFVKLLLTVRQELRAAKQWALADHIRDQLRELGVVVEDQPGGSTWHFE